MSAELAGPKQVNVTTPAPPTPLPAVAAMERDQQSAGSAEKTIMLIARSLGRQAARRHVARGWSIAEVAILLVAGALIIAAALYLKTPIGRLP